MIKLTYFDRIGKYGVNLKDVGNVHSPILADLSKSGYTQYQYSLTMLLHNVESFMAEISKATKEPNIWDSITDEQKSQISIFDILTTTKEYRAEVGFALSFFISGKLEWDDRKKAFLVNARKEEDGKISVDGLIDRNNYSTVANVCMQLAGIEIDELEADEGPKKFKSEKDRIFYEKFMKKKKEKKRGKKQDPDFELPNMISVICTYHNSLNYSNIFDLTVAQVHDTFNRLIREKQISIQDMNYAVWGGKHDPMTWIKRMDVKEEL